MELIFERYFSLITECVGKKKCNQTIPIIKKCFMQYTLIYSDVKEKAQSNNENLFGNTISEAPVVVLIS